MGSVLSFIVISSFIVCSCVCVPVCLSVKLHLTSGASLRREKSAACSAGNEDKKNCGVFSETPPFPRWRDPSLGRPGGVGQAFVVA